MCSQNINCSKPDGTCNCANSTQTQSFPLLYHSLFSILSMKANVLQDLNQRVIQLNQKVEEFSSQFEQKGKADSSEIATPSAIVKSLSKGTPYQYKFKQLNDLPELLYKERNFSLKFILVDSNSNPVILPKPEKFKLGLFTVNTPPIDLVERTGSAIIRGNIETSSVSEVEFRKICVNEVSSHYRNGVFCLAVKTESDSLVQPLVIPDIVVKARKMKDEPKKIIKFKEGSL